MSWVPPERRPEDDGNDFIRMKKRGTSALEAQEEDASSSSSARTRRDCQTRMSHAVEVLVRRIHMKVFRDSMIPGSDAYPPSRAINTDRIKLWKETTQAMYSFLRPFEELNKMHKLLDIAAQVALRAYISHERFLAGLWDNAFKSFFSDFDPCTTDYMLYYYNGHERSIIKSATEMTKSNYWMAMLLCEYARQHNLTYPVDFALELYFTKAVADYCARPDRKRKLRLVAVDDFIATGEQMHRSLFNMQHSQPETDVVISCHCIPALVTRRYLERDSYKSTVHYHPGIVIDNCIAREFERQGFGSFREFRAIAHVPFHSDAEQDLAYTDVKVADDLSIGSCFLRSGCLPSRSFIMPTKFARNHFEPDDPLVDILRKQPELYSKLRAEFPKIRSIREALDFEIIKPMIDAIDNGPEAIRELARKYEEAKQEPERVERLNIGIKLHRLFLACLALQRGEEEEEEEDDYVPSLSSFLNSRKYIEMEWIPDVRESVWYTQYLYVLIEREEKKST